MSDIKDCYYQSIISRMCLKGDKVKICTDCINKKAKGDKVERYNK